MRRLLVLLVCGLFALSQLSGCQGPGRDESGVAPAPAPPGGGVDVIVEGGGEFPEFIAGRWKADRDDWEFTFEPDGRISSAIINLGRVAVEPGKISRFPTRGGGKGIFEPGLWTVRYTPESRELCVIAVIKDFYEDLGKHAIKGNQTDILIGPISEDGKTWSAEWYMLGKYVALIPEPNEFSNVTEPQFRKFLIFEKVEQEE